MEKFNESLPFDKRMWAEDIKGSQVCQGSACLPLLVLPAVCHHRATGVRACCACRPAYLTVSACLPV